MLRMDARAGQPPHWLLGSHANCAGIHGDPASQPMWQATAAHGPGSTNVPGGNAWGGSGWASAGVSAAQTPASAAALGAPALCPNPNPTYYPILEHEQGIATLVGGLERRLAAAEAAAAAAADQAVALASRATVADAAAGVARAERAALAARLTVVEGRLRFLEAGDPGGTLAIQAGLPGARAQTDALALEPAPPATEGLGNPASAWRARGSFGAAAGARVGNGAEQRGSASKGGANPGGALEDGPALQDPQVAELRVRGTAIPRPPAPGAPAGSATGLGSGPAPAGRAEAPPASPAPLPPARHARPAPGEDAAGAAAASADTAGGPGAGAGSQISGGGGARFGSTEELIRALQSRYQEASAFLAQEGRALPQAA